MLAEESAPLFEQSIALSNFAASLHQFRREAGATQERSEAGLAISLERGFSNSAANARVMRGWALAIQGQGEEGIELIQQGLSARQEMGSERNRIYYLSLMAEAYAETGDFDEGLRALTEALALIEKTGECWYESEIYRLWGALLLSQSQDHQTDAESCFQHSLCVARNQQTKSWELRAVTSLARLWQSQYKYTEAHELLAPVYGWFTEGFDTVDLKEAKGLLEELPN